jgi:hypothetical protein
MRAATICIALIAVIPSTTMAVTLNAGDIVVATGIGPASAKDHGLVLVDPATGNRTIISDNSTGTGPTFNTTEGVAIEPDGDLLVTDLTAGGLGSRVIRVNPTTGDRTVISGPGTGAGVRPDRWYGIVELNGTILVANSYSQDTAAILSIDPATGNRTALSGDGVGTGPSFLSPVGLVVQGNHLLLSDYYGLVFQVDLATGNRSRVGAGDFPAYPEAAAGLAVSSNGTILVSGQVYDNFPNNYPGVFTQDPTTHFYSIVSGYNVGTGPTMGNLGPTGIATAASGTILLDESTLNAVLSIDPITGNRTIL